MSIKEHTNTPSVDESLAFYVQRLRKSLGLSQKELALKAGVHLQSIGKIERGKTTRLNQKMRSGLAIALEVSCEYLDAVCRRMPVSELVALKFCPECWIPGTAPDSLWSDARAKFCSLCGTALRSRCASCNEPITSMKYRFCPFCGTPYKPKA